MTPEQYERVIETLVNRIERAESDEAVIRLMEILSDFRRSPPDQFRACPP